MPQATCRGGAVAGSGGVRGLGRLARRKGSAVRWIKRYGLGEVWCTVSRAESSVGVAGRPEPRVAILCVDISGQISESPCPGRPEPRVAIVTAEARAYRYDRLVWLSLRLAPR